MAAKKQPKSVFDTVSSFDRARSYGQTQAQKPGYNPMLGSYPGMGSLPPRTKPILKARPAVKKGVPQGEFGVVDPSNSIGSLTKGHGLQVVGPAKKPATQAGRLPGFHEDNTILERTKGYVPVPGQGLGKKPTTTVKPAAKPAVRPAAPKVKVGAGAGVATSGKIPVSTGSSAAPAPITAPAASSYPGYMTPQQLLQAALAQVNPALAGQISTENQAFGQGTQAIKAAYNALANLSKPLDNTIEGIYTRAAGTTGALGAGLSDATLEKSVGDAAGLNMNLDPNSPQQIRSLLKDGGRDVLYQLGGYIPGSTLTREGAAWAAAAAKQPDIHRAQGADALKALLGTHGANLAKIEAQRPSLLQKAIADLQNADIKKRAVAVNESIALGSQAVKAQEATAKAAAAARKEDRQAAEFAWKQRIDYARTMGVDPVTGRQTVAGKRLVDQLKRNEKSSAKFTPSQIQSQREKAMKDADLFFYGKVSKTNSQGQPIAGIPGIDYQKAFFRISRKYKGLKIDDIQAILDSFYQPGDRLRPYLNFQQRQALAERGGFSQAQLDQAMWDPNVSAQLLAALNQG